MTGETGNILELPDPDSWGCSVTHLAKGHGLLTIDLINRGVTHQAKGLEFTHVDYFSGWTAWKGADFRIGTDQEFVELIRRIAPRYESVSEHDLLNTHPFDTTRLYICKTAQGDLIYINAMGGRTFDADNNTIVEA